MKTQRILIRGNDGMWRADPIDAIVFGVFAVHAADLRPRRRWTGHQKYTITHIASGYSLGHAWPRRLAIANAQALNSVLPEGDFTADDFDSEMYRLFVQNANALLRDSLQELTP